MTVDYFYDCHYILLHKKKMRIYDNNIQIIKFIIYTYDNNI